MRVVCLAQRHPVQLKDMRASVAVCVSIAGMSAAGSDPQLAQGIQDGPDLFLEDTLRYAIHAAHA